MKKLILLIFILFSCFQNKEKSEFLEIFKIKIGFNENDLGLFSKNDIINNNTITVENSGGFFYISDIKNNKIMKITRTGVPILILYNPDNNPHFKATISNNPLNNDNTNDNKDDNSSDIAFVKIYREFDIYSPGQITSDIDKNIYLVNNLPKYKKINNDESVSESMILKFSRKGDLLFLLGNEGINTNPFGNISDLIVDNGNNLIIQENTIKEYIFYKFDPSGKLTAKIIISNNDIPILNKERDYIVDILDAKAGYLENEIYITCQYVKKTTQNFSMTTYETQYEKIFKYSIINKKITKMVMKLEPQYIDITKMKKNEKNNVLFGDKTKILRPFLNYIGTDISGNFYFSERQFTFDELNQNIHIIFIYDNKSHLKTSQEVKFPGDIEYCSDFFISPEGKIYSYYVRNGEIQFVSIKQ